VTGRVVRDVFKGNLRAGTKSMTWDGQDDRGRQLPRGVYFAQVRYQRSGFNDARKVVVLK
jgi:flagellar hook assembly protein FlgD